MELKIILNELVELGFEVEVVPASTKADDIINNFKAGKIGGVVLSSGAGNPNILTDEIAEIKKINRRKYSDSCSWSRTLFTSTCKWCKSR